MVSNLKKEWSIIINTKNILLRYVILYIIY